jgi:dolichol-phosphate mannosyltransferase
LTSAAVDAGVYTLLGWLLRGLLSGLSLTAVAGIGARVLSSLLNFFLNKNLVFASTVSTWRAMVRYYALALPQMAAQVLLTQGVYALLGIADTATGLRTVIYAVVMTALYVLSFMIQQRWVFAAERKEKV